MSTISKARRIVGWILTVVLSLLFIFSATLKLTKSEQAVEMLQKWGLGNEVLLIGAGELVSAVLFLIPYTHSLGVLLLSGYMGGAIATHMQNADSYVRPSVILAVIWLTAFLRHPEVFQSFRDVHSKQPPVES